jgi:membrane-associated protease RseP (regulator of RpoE activity)
MTDATGPDDPTPIDPTPVEPATEPAPAATDAAPAADPAAATDPAAEPITVLDPTEPEPVAAAPAGAERSGDDGTVRVQRWVVLALATFAVGAIGFALGWIAAPGDGDGGGGERASVTIETPRDLRDLFGPEGPFGRGRGAPDQGGNGRGETPRDETPRGQAPRATGGFLGVITRATTDPDGARIERVLDDSPAAEADLETGDVITKVDDEDIDGPEALADAIGDHDPDDEVTITYERDGTSATVRVKLGDRASADLRAPGGPSFDF